MAVQGNKQAKETPVAAYCATMRTEETEDEQVLARSAVIFQHDHNKGAWKTEAIKSS
jgi:hypothetical protein